MPSGVFGGIMWVWCVPRVVWGGACNHRIGPERIGGNYRIGPNFPLIYEFYVTFLEYLRPNKQSNHIGSLVGDQWRTYLSLK